MLFSHEQLVVIAWNNILSMKFCFALHQLNFFTLVTGLSSYAVLSQTALFIRSKRMQFVAGIPPQTVVHTDTRV
jgi:hypothetical protein